MTGWDVLDKIIAAFPPVAMAILLAVAVVFVVVFAIGFARHGISFIKYGFKQTEISDLGAKIDGLRNEFKTELDEIKVNHFGHLKDFLAELTGILLDKNIINNTDKARLDSKLRGM